MRDIISKYRSDQARDDHGRFSSGGDASDDADARGLLRASMVAMKAHATNLAAKVKHTITTTRFAGASPTLSGGIEVRATHELPGTRGTIESYAQAHPHMLTSPTARKALAALHGALVQSGVPPVPMKMPVIGATFKR
jgi:hypothetical protein